MISLTYVLFGVFLTLVLGAVYQRHFTFTAQRPQDYAGDQGANLDIRTHLNGPLICEGVIYGPTGRVASRFVGEFEAQWSGNQGVMKEHFRYDSGAEQHREWHLTLGNDGRIRATAADVVGEGQGQQSGPSVQLRYRIRLPEDSGGHVLDTTDWMYLTPNGTIVNRSQFRKFGIKVAELVATMRQKETA
ncbi:DUF3833 domain-containing protein [Antarctobacter jejuensis]|uniref:DUF3833 domain-containing protein n=1 Tax=Antarctobacter jejuensis TaxID=1439938 RepID=UPI003FD32092